MDTSDGHHQAVDYREHQRYTRWIKCGKIDAKQIDGRWVVFCPDICLYTDQPSVQPVDHLQSEIQHLREALARRDRQIEQQTILLAMLAQQST